MSLSPSSSLIDKGTDTVHKYDFLGTARPQGAKFDLGAFERSSN
ncbi:MAG TPA: choice-of-anchor Q domain-containing protein [Polyangiaceae bacterium]|nr:choice-of-anchor Q domain-containing protein [Polyangiaceae bacterium]HMR73484.1 choice-of-anchor Q domain-containing protein [Polyangiaceae bacterium]